MIKGRGGAGRGQGRKPVGVMVKREAKAIRLPAWIWQWVDQQENDRGHVIEEALREHYKISLGDGPQDAGQGEQQANLPIENSSKSILVNATNS